MDGAAKINNDLVPSGFDPDLDVHMQATTAPGQGDERRDSKLTTSPGRRRTKLPGLSPEPTPTNPRDRSPLRDLKTEDTSGSALPAFYPSHRTHLPCTSSLPRRTPACLACDNPFPPLVFHVELSL